MQEEEVSEKHEADGWGGGSPFGNYKLKDDNSAEPAAAAAVAAPAEVEEKEQEGRPEARGE